MKYDPSKHLLRPLVDKEILEPTDLWEDSKGRLIPLGEASGFASDIGKTKAECDTCGTIFRPVPVPQWRPRSEAHLIREAADFAAILWKCDTARYATGISYKNDPVPSGFTHFYVVPPCDLPKPDPERERFENYQRREGHGHVLARTNDGGYEDSYVNVAWHAWQAARKEGVV